MKYLKERKFVKQVNEILKEEVNVSRIIVLESSSQNKEINYVLYEDRFGRQFRVDTFNGKLNKEEIVRR